MEHRSVLETPIGIQTKFDLKDLRLIAMLSEDARTTFSYMAQVLHLSKDAVRYRYNKLVELGLIAGNISIVNPFALGFEAAFIFLRMNTLPKEAEQDLLNYFSQHQHTMWVGTTLGNYDFILFFAIKNNAHLKDIIMGIKSKCGHALMNLHLIPVNSITSYMNFPPKMIEDLGIKMERRKADHSFGDLLVRPVMSSDSPKATIDDLDGNLIIDLARNANEDLVSLSRKYKVHTNTVKQRIRNLIHNKVICAFNTLINISQIGLNAFVIFLQLNYQAEKSKVGQLDTFLNNISAYVYKANGEWDYLIFVGTKNITEFYNLLLGVRNTFPDLIKNYSTLTLIKDFKFTFLPQGIAESIKNNLSIFIKK